MSLFSRSSKVANRLLALRKSSSPSINRPRFVLQQKNPALLVEKAVKGMLPKNKLGAELFRNLNVVVGTEHKQGAQKPKTVNLNDLK